MTEDRLAVTASGEISEPDEEYDNGQDAEICSPAGKPKTLSTQKVSEAIFDEFRGKGRMFQ